MHAFDILGDPVRRRILELLAAGEMPAGGIVDAVTAEFGITQPAVSHQLRILRDAGFAEARADGRRRLYALRPEPFREAQAWLERYGAFWTQRLDALDTEVARVRRQREEDPT